MNIIQKPSPNFNSKDKNGNDWIITPKLIVVHWTAGIFSGAANWLCDIKSQVSSHFIIDHTGQMIFQLVDLNRRAWHCGGSYHRLLNKDTNSETIGIECEGPPSIIGTNAWSDDFINGLVELCQYVKQQVPTIIGIVDHHTIDPSHKGDVKGGTGKDLFPWDSFIQKTGMFDFTVDYAIDIKRHFGMS